MILKTLIEYQNQLVKAEVEIEMIPGVPQIHFLGLPDRVIKESFFRIKSALKSTGFKFPVSSQVIVNIRPTSLKKSSTGLELAVALGILHLTGQKQFADDFTKAIIYGELQLDGGVIEPDNLKLYKPKMDGETIVTGLSKKETNHKNYEIVRWEKLSEDLYFETKTKKQNYQRPKIGLDSTYNTAEAELASNTLVEFDAHLRAVQALGQLEDALQRPFDALKTIEQGRDQQATTKQP